ncbi:MAG TPA: response regulator transcription factor [Solirubrobacteraceae bacterium]|jgi:DNA-binding response OmpR family regulator
MRVLVVEDAPRLAKTIAEGLRDHGIAVDIAYEGRDAAAKLDLNPYDVVVLDRDLPGIHGDELCRLITGSDDPAMVLMLTAASAPGERVTGLRLGADDYLAKPFHFPELVLRVRTLARRKPTAQAHLLRAGDLELDPLHRQVIRAGQQRELSATEFNLLEALIRASPAPLSAEDLLARAWDENADPFTQTVRVTIGRLRRKLGEPDIIQTIRGVGYRMTD